MLARAFASIAFASLLLAPSLAHAEKELSGNWGTAGTIALDQLSGFRASISGGVDYSGPIGFSTSHVSENELTGGTGSATTKATTFWLAPSADYFLFDHFSVGGIVEIATTSSSVTVPTNGSTTQTFSLPTATNFTIVPRVGYLLNLNDRFGIWPRAGIGYASRQVVSGSLDTSTRDDYSSLVFDLDVGFLYRLTETVFLRAAPEIAFSAGGTHSQTQGAVTVKADASLFQFDVAAGVGVFLP